MAAAYILQGALDRLTGYSGDNDRWTLFKHRQSQIVHLLKGNIASTRVPPPGAAIAAAYRRMPGRVRSFR